MTDRSRLILLVYLDLLFALFAGIGLINLVLASGRGRTPHQLDKDFLILTVYWSEGRRPGPRPPAALVPAGGEEAAWVRVVDGEPDEDDRGGRTVYVAAPLGGRAWRFEPRTQPGGQAWALGGGAVEKITYSTRAGTRTVDPADADHILVSTEAAR